MVGVEQIPYAKPKWGQTELFIGSFEDEKREPIKLNVEFCDGAKDGYIAVRVDDSR